jgi:hypothetical protein
MVLMMMTMNCSLICLMNLMNPKLPSRKAKLQGFLVAGRLIDAAAVAETMNCCSVPNSVGQAM